MSLPLYFDGQQFRVYTYQATFIQFDHTCFRYDNDQGALHQYVDRWWHMHDLDIQPFTLNSAQKARLAQLNDMGIEHVDAIKPYVNFVLYDAVDPRTTQPHLVEHITEERSQHYRDVLKEVLLRQVADRRYVVETQGIVVNDQSIPTDRNVQGLLDRAFQPLNAGIVDTITFKYPFARQLGRFQEMDLTAFRHVYSAVVQHVQHCFKIESQVAENTILVEEDQDNLLRMNGAYLFDVAFGLITSADEMQLSPTQSGSSTLT